MPLAYLRRGNEDEAQDRCLEALKGSPMQPEAAHLTCSQGLKACCFVTLFVLGALRALPYPFDLNHKTTKSKMGSVCLSEALLRSKGAV